MKKTTSVWKQNQLKKAEEKRHKLATKLLTLSLLTANLLAIYKLISLIK